jgi:ring-1,2-phenylacetyl-CoA epoxidase subunit PaaE
VKSSFYPLRVKNIEHQTRNSVAIEFEVPAELRETFKFEAGQYLTLRTQIGGENVRRNYSLCSSPLENKWKVGIKKVQGGLFSTWANETLQAGAVVEVMPPMGKFTPQLHTTNAKSYCAFAAGSGITPILSIIKTVLVEEPDSSFTLIYGNQSRSSIMFKEELEALKDKYLHRFSLYHILSREKTDADINYGRIDAAKCEQIFLKLLNLQSIDTFFLCGPEAMSLGVKEFLLKKGIDEKKIRLELFTTTAKTGNRKNIAQKQEDETPKSKVIIRHDGVESALELAYESDSILDAAIHEGIELPFACKGGMCCTCKAKLVKGEVDMDVHYGLEHDEMEAGYILTCQSHPKTAEVVVDFDER